MARRWRTLVWGIAVVVFLLGTALFVAWLVMTLIVAIKASEGATYRYPISLRFVT